MVPLSIIGMSPEGNPYFPLCAVPGPWAPSGGGACSVVCAPRELVGPPRHRPAWSAPGLSHRVPHAVLTPSWWLLRPHLLPCCAAPSARSSSVRGRPWPRDRCCKERR
jgi:hypothetical protein